MNNIFTLLVIYQLKHFLADYPLQGRYMLGKFKNYPEYVKPLLAHSAVHAVFTFSIALLYKPELAIYLAILDAAVHFIVDRVKASPKLLGRFTSLSKNEYIELVQIKQSLENERNSGIKDDRQETNQNLLERQIERINDRFKSNVYFWWSLGADQMAHHLTHYLLIWMMLK